MRGPCPLTAGPAQPSAVMWKPDGDALWPRWAFQRSQPPALRGEPRPGLVADTGHPRTSPTARKASSTEPDDRLYRRPTRRHNYREHGGAPGGYREHGGAPGGYREHGGAPGGGAVSARHAGAGSLVRGLEARCHSPGKQLPAFTLLCGVQPAKERRRQWTATLHPPGRLHPGTAGSPHRPATHSRGRPALLTAAAGPHNYHPPGHRAAAAPAHDGEPAWQIFTPLPRHPRPQTTVMRGHATPFRTVDDSGVIASRVLPPGPKTRPQRPPAGRVRPTSATGG